MTLKEKQLKMIESINALGDCFDQYNYLVIKAQELPDLPEERKKAEVLVPGCQSRVWLYAWAKDGRLYFEADSDTLILRGVLQLLKELLCGELCGAVVALDVELFAKTELAATFTSDRNTGIKSILAELKLISAAENG